MASDKLEIKVYDDSKQLVDREIVMTFGLLNVLARLVGDINRIGLIDLVSETADEVMFEVLSERDSKGRPVDRKAVVPDMPAEDANRVFDWVKESLMDFFIRRLLNTADLMQRNQAKMALVASSMVSSKN